MFERDDFSELVGNLPIDIQDMVVERLARESGWDATVDIVIRCVRESIESGWIEEDVRMAAGNSRYVIHEDLRSGRTPRVLDRMGYYESFPGNLIEIANWIGFCLDLGLDDEAARTALITADAIEGLDEKDRLLKRYNMDLAEFIRTEVDHGRVRALSSSFPELDPPE